METFYAGFFRSLTGIAVDCRRLPSVGVMGSVGQCRRLPSVDVLHRRIGCLMFLPISLAAPHLFRFLSRSLPHSSVFNFGGFRATFSVFSGGSMRAGSEGWGVLQSCSRVDGSMIFMVSRIQIPRMFGVFSRLSFSRVFSKLFSAGTRLSWKLLSNPGLGY